MRLSEAAALFALMALAAAAVSADRKDRRPGFANDLGPETIDVSPYPVDMQKKYALFQAKCGVCHTPARAVNSEFISEKDWSRYIKRMAMRPPCCNFCPVISHEDSKAIWQFLAYDSAVRKTGPRAASWAAYRAVLLQEYKSKYPKQYAERYEKKNENNDESEKE